MKGAVVERFGDGHPRRRRRDRPGEGREDRLLRPRGAHLARAAPPPARRRQLPRLARGARGAPRPAGPLRDGGAAPLRGRRRVALRQGRRRHRLAGGARVAPHRPAARARAAARPGGGEGPQGGLRLRERRHARRPGRVRVRRRGHPVRCDEVRPQRRRAPGRPRGRLLLRRGHEAVLVRAAALPARVRAHRARARATSTTSTRRSSRRSSTARASSTRTRARRRARSGSCSCSRARRRESPSYTGGSRFEVDDLYDPEINVRYGSFYLRRLLRQVRGRAAGARRVQRRPGQRRRVGRGGPRGDSLPRDAGVRRERPRGAGGLRAGLRGRARPRRARSASRGSSSCRPRDPCGTGRGPARRGAWSPRLESRASSVSSPPAPRRTSWPRWSKSTSAPPCPPSDVVPAAAEERVRAAAAEDDVVAAEPSELLDGRRPGEASGPSVPRTSGLQLRTISPSLAKPSRGATWIM